MIRISDLIKAILFVIALAVAYTYGDYRGATHVHRQLAPRSRWEL